MTQNRRIFLNIVATYGRSLYALVIGLFCGRWTLMSLGEVDYGLMGLVGGMMGFVGFFNAVLANANSRFYAVSIGAANVAKDKIGALEECRRWFNTALSIHLVVPILSIVIGYPIGVYTIEHWLTIPPDRIGACVWVFRFTCLSCFVGMINVPFTAMYTAKQYIAELTIYSFITTTLNALMLGYMVTHPGVWLAKFACWTAALSVVPQIIICLRAVIVFPECKIRVQYMYDWERLKKIGTFSGWQIIGFFVNMTRQNGMTIVVNKFFGAAMNAAQGIGTTVLAHCNQLAGAMQGAFNPVIIQSYGEGDMKKMHRFVLCSCRFNVLLSAVFMIPLALELPEVLCLWLKTPPACSVGLCYCAMATHIIWSSVVGHMIAVDAVGRLALYHCILGPIYLLALPLAIFFGLIWRNVYLMMSSIVLTEAIYTVGKLLMARHLAGISIRAWLRQVFCPVVVLIVVSFVCGWLPHLLMPASFWRVCLTTLATELVFMPLSWFFVLRMEERQVLVDRFGNKLRRIWGGTVK